MPFKPTRRRNGDHMVTIRIEHYVTREVMVDTIATEFEDRIADDDDLTRTEVEQAVRDAYRAHGGEWDITAGDLRAELGDETEAIEWADEQVTRLYPGWRK